MQQKTKKKRSVCMVFQKNEGGFTLITTLAMLSLIVITIPFLSYSLLISETNTNYYENSLHEFYRFIRNEIIASNDYYVQNNELHLVQGDDIAIISHYDQLIRRQVNKRGHEVYLNDVTHFEINETEDGIHMLIVDLKGKINEKKFVFYSQ